MDKNWSEMNKEIQVLLSKEATLSQAIEKLIAFRADMFEQIRQIVMSYPAEAFWQMPFAGADGYHSKTLGYSIWHIFRIEDIVAHEMIAEDPQDRQIFQRTGYQGTVPVCTGSHGIYKPGFTASYLGRYETKIRREYGRKTTGDTLRQRKRRGGLADSLLVRKGCPRFDQNAFQQALAHAYRGDAPHQEQAV